MTTAYGKWLWGSGTYSAGIDLAGGMTPAVTFNATMSNPVLLTGDILVAVDIPDTSPSLLMNLVGGLTPQIVMGGVLGDTVLGSGNISFTIAMAASMDSGPVWEPSELCGDPGWEETGPCNG